MATKKPKTLHDYLADAQTQHFNIGHAAELLELLGDTIGAPRQRFTDLEMQAIGLRVEYLANLIREHNDTLGKALSAAEG